MRPGSSTVLSRKPTPWRRGLEVDGHALALPVAVARRLGSGGAAALEGHLERRRLGGAALGGLLQSTARGGGEHLARGGVGRWRVRHAGLLQPLARSRHAMEPGTW